MQVQPDTGNNEQDDDLICGHNPAFKNKYKGFESTYPISKKSTPKQQIDLLQITRGLCIGQRGHCSVMRGHCRG